MSEARSLLDAYRRHIRIAWDPALAGPQRVWFLVHEPAQERRMRFLLGEFANATNDAGHGWKLVDLDARFGTWVGQLEYRDAYLEEPEYLDEAMPQFARYLSEALAAELDAPDAGPETVVALIGVGSLFGLARVSALIEAVAPKIRGRLLVFFPGERDGSSYRLLGAGDGWNYLAVPITATEGA